MKWLKKQMASATYLQSDCGRWRISKVNPRNPVYTLWDMSDGPAKFIANFKTLDEAKEAAK